VSAMVNFKCGRVLSTREFNLQPLDQGADDSPVAVSPDSVEAIPVAQRELCRFSDEGDLFKKAVAQKRGSSMDKVVAYELRRVGSNPTKGSTELSSFIPCLYSIDGGAEKGYFNGSL